MRSKGTGKELEARRLRAMELLQKGYKGCEVARTLGVTPGAVSQWKSHWQQGGRSALAARPVLGPPSRLSPRQHESLARMLLQGPEAHGFSTGLWTLARVRQVICRHFGVCYDPSGVWHVLRRMNWSCQKPERKARERDERAIGRWRKKTWPRLKKSPPKWLEHRVY